MGVADVCDRWRKTVSTAQSADRIEQHKDKSTSLNRTLNVVVSHRKTPLGPKPMDKTTKFKKAVNLCRDLSDLISMTGGEQYVKRMDVLEKILTIWQSGKEVAVVPINAAGILEFGKYHT